MRLLPDAMDDGSVGTASEAGPHKACQREQVHASRSHPGIWQGLAGQISNCTGDMPYAISNRKGAAWHPKGARKLACHLCHKSLSNGLPVLWTLAGETGEAMAWKERRPWPLRACGPAALARGSSSAPSSTLPACASWPTMVVAFGLCDVKGGGCLRWHPGRPKLRSRCIRLDKRA